VHKLAAFTVRFRWPLMAAAALLTALSLLGIRHLQIEVDMVKYLPPDDPVVKLFDHVGDKFKGNVLALVAVEADDVFTPRVLKRIRRLTRAFKLVDGVVSVNSLTDILDIRQGEGGGLEVGKLIDARNLPEEPEALERLKKYTLGKEMYRGVLVSEDASVCLIMARLANDADRLSVARELRNIALEEKGEEKYYFGGMPFQMDTIADIMMRDMKHLIPAVSLLVLLTLFLGFRSLRGVLLPLAVVIMACTWTLGLMGAIGIPLTMLSDLMPVLLIAVGTAYAIHVINRYGEESAGTGDCLQAARRTVSGVGLAVMMAGLTTAIGFISFFSSSLSLVRQFGLFTAVGVFIALVLSLTFVPAVLSLLRHRVPRHMKDASEHGTASRFTDAFFGLVVGHRRVVLVLAVLVVGAAVAGLPRISREVNMLEYFDPREDIRITETMMENKFGGSVPIQVQIRGDIKDPAVLREMLRLEKFLRTLPVISNPQSAADLVVELNDVMNDRRTIPDTRQGVENLWLFIEGQDILDQLIDSEGKEAIVQANVNKVDTGHIRELTAKLQRYLETEMNLDLVAVDTGGPLPAGLGNIVDSVRVENMAEAIERDVAFRAPGHAVDGRRLRELLSQAVASRQWPLAGTPAGEIAGPIMDYLTGPDADVEISADRARALAAAVGEKAAAGPLNIPNLEKMVRAHLPAGAEEDDPEAAGYAAEAIEARIDQLARQARLDDLRRRITTLIPRSALENRYFIKELQADLWAVNDGRAFIPLQKLAGAADLEKLAVKPVHIEARQTGMPAIFSKIDRELVLSQVESLLFSLGLVFLLIVLQFRSLKAGLLGVVPIVVTVATELGVMAYAGIALDAFLVMIAAVAVGIGIDYTIHVMSRYRAETGAGVDPEQAIANTLRSSGRAIILNAATVTFGFLVFLGGSLVPLRNFGLLVAITMVVSALAALTLLPALMLLVKLRLRPGTAPSGAESAKTPAGRNAGGSG